jgi:hypothetical protein
MSSTIAFLCSNKRLKKVLLPTFGLPTIATVNPMFETLTRPLPEGRGGILFL